MTEQEFEQYLELKAKYDAFTMVEQKPKDPTLSEQLFERAAQLKQTSDDIMASVNDVVTQINILYASKMICLKPTTPELAKLYDEGLAVIAKSLVDESIAISEIAKIEEEKENN